MNSERTYTGLPGIEPAYRGKVRDVFDCGDLLLVVATDRISAYDSILPTPIPGKGIMLNMISAAWFERFDTVPSHLVSVEVEDFPSPFNGFEGELAGRSMLVKKAERIDLECIVRGYITGSGWKEYRRTGAVCGVVLPADLSLSQRLDEPIFTPSTKADSGHDENISLERAAEIVGADTIDGLRRMSLELYESAAEYARERGIIIADTKFEFGRVDGEIIVIDEMLTPDSSRFWLAEEYEPGKPQRSLDKQFLRDYLDGIGWNHDPPAPPLPPEVVAKTLERYRLAVDRLFPDLNIGRYL